MFLPALLLSALTQHCVTNHLCHSPCWCVTRCMSQVQRFHKPYTPFPPLLQQQQCMPGYHRFPPCPQACPHSCAPAPPAQGGTAGLKLRMHHSSVLARVRPQWVVFHSVQQGDSGWHDMQGVTVVQPDWLLEAAPHMFSRRQPALW